VRKEDQEELRINGFGKGYSLFALALQTIGFALIITIIVAISADWRKMVIFMGAGDRCTGTECAAIERRLSLLEARELPPPSLLQDVADQKLEDRRLQQQIDRLENEVFFGKRKPPLQPYTGD
jgi:hypothetical protein